MPAALSPDATIAEIVTSHPEAARVFQRHRLDFCCGGDVPLAQACAGRGLDAAVVRAELERALAEALPGEGPDAAALSTPALLAHLVGTHHAYLRQALPYLLPLSAKVARVHGEHNPALVPLDRTVQALAAALLPHLAQEEEELFPGLAGGATPEWLARELAGMLEDHAAVGRLLHDLRALSEDFTTPAWGCRSYQVLMHELEALETDTLRHVHLENHVLAPRFAPRAA